MAEPSSNANRRRYPRLPISLKTEGRWRDSSGQEHPLKGLLLWLSEGGTQLRCADPIPANAVVRIQIRLGVFQRFEPTGRVRWWRRHGEVRDLGIQFSEPVRRIGEIVEKQLASKQPKSAR